MPVLLLFLSRYRVTTNRAFEVRPSVVGTCEAAVDLLPSLLSNVVDKNPTRVGLDVEAVGVPEPQRPNSLVVTRGICVEWVIRGDRTILVYPEHLAEGSVQGLGSLDITIIIGSRGENSGVSNYISIKLRKIGRLVRLDEVAREL
jgi:hypothetical protein